MTSGAASTALSPARSNIRIDQESGLKPSGWLDANRAPCTVAPEEDPPLGEVTEG